MDPKYTVIGEQSIFPNSDRHPDDESGFNFDSPSSDLNFVNVLSDSSDFVANDLGLSFAFSPGGESLSQSLVQGENLLNLLPAVVRREMLLLPLLILILQIQYSNT